MTRKNSKFRFFKNPNLSRSLWVRGVMAFCLLFAVVQPWKLPVPFLEQSSMVEATSSGLGLPANEEDNLNEKVQSSSEGPFFEISKEEDRLLTDPSNGVPSPPFFEVPTPPPRG